MSPIIASLTKPEYSIPDGKYPARLFQIIQLGSQKFSKNDKEWYSPQILLGFELPTLTFEGKGGDTLSQIKSGTYFLSLNPSRNGALGLREVIDGLRGSSEYTEEELEKFDISKFLDCECEIVLEGVESKGTVYQNIVAVHPLSFKQAGLDLQAYREPIMITEDDFADIEMRFLPDWITSKIKASKEYKDLTPKVYDPKEVPFPSSKELAEEKKATDSEEMPDDFLEV